MSQQRREQRPSPGSNDSRRSLANTSKQWLRHVVQETKRENQASMCSVCVNRVPETKERERERYYICSSQSGCKDMINNMEARMYGLCAATRCVVYFCFCFCFRPQGWRAREGAGSRPLARHAPPLPPPPRCSPRTGSSRRPAKPRARRRGPACARRAAACDAGPQGRALGHGQPPAGHHRQGRRGVPEEVQRARPRKENATALGQHVAQSCCALWRGRRLSTSVGVALTTVGDSLSQQIKLANQILAEDIHQPMYKVPGPRTVPVCCCFPVHAWPQSRMAPAHLALEALKDV